MTDSTPLLSLEDLRPQTFAELLGQDHAVRVLQGLVERYRSPQSCLVPSFLFAGPPGTGKTTAALILARDLLGADFDGNFLELNASNERKIETVRTTIESFANHEPNGTAPFRVLLLDEFDEMTEAAQSALRRLMETSTTCRFILTCNHSSKVIDAIHSRCLNLGFRPLNDANLRILLNGAAKRLSLETTAELIDSIVARSSGQARDALYALSGGSDESRRMAVLDERIRDLFKPANGTSNGVRIESFVQFCRSEGYTDGEDLIAEIDRVVRGEKLVGDGKPIRDFTEAIAQCAFRCATVKVDLIQVRSSCYQMLGGGT